MTKKRGPTARALERWLLAAPLLAAAACGGPQDLGALGATCFRDDDCEAGLICVAPTADDVARVCNNDPTPLISNVEGPPVMEMMAGTGAAGMGGSMPVAGGGMGGAMAVAGGGTGGAAAGTGGTDAAGSGGTGGSGGTDSAGSAGTGGSGGTEPEGGAPQ